MSHIHDLIDFTVAALIVYNRKILRVDDREVGQWLTPGGHIEPHEDTDRALYREIEEETGLMPSDIEIIGEKPFSLVQNSLWPPRWVSIHSINNHHRHIVFIYLIKAKTEKVRLAPDEHHQIRWFSHEEINDSSLNIQADVRAYAKEAFRLIA